ncbi:PIG-L family deacetylase [Streptomyces sp. NPDC048825]|uniref:PIG-L family deacetylase n=1 Tax=Streptomyces sp. NPDC048825 TaxID=3365592 RepID=UPI003712E26E
MTGPWAGGAGLPDDLRRVLAVVAHPDDESFRLGGLLALLSARGVPTTVLCFTHGEASTLHAGPGDLRTVRADELACAARELGVERVELADYPDDGLAAVPLGRLAARVGRLITERRPTHLLVFDTTGVTGHRDHRRATEAALAAARERGVQVLGWTLPRAVAEAMNREFGASFAGREPGECHEIRSVPRARQRRAIAFPQSRLRSTGRDPHRKPVDRQSGAVASPRTPRRQRVPASTAVTSGNASLSGGGGTGRRGRRILGPGGPDGLGDAGLGYEPVGEVARLVHGQRGPGSRFAAPDGAHVERDPADRPVRGGGQPQKLHLDPPTAGGHQRRLTGRTKPHVP